MANLLQRRARVSLVAHFSTTDERKPLPISDTSLNTETPYNICFVRHGQSTWNRDNRFIGWTGKHFFGFVLAIIVISLVMTWALVAFFDIFILSIE